MSRGFAVYSGLFHFYKAGTSTNPTIIQSRVNSKQTRYIKTLINKYTVPKKFHHNRDDGGQEMYEELRETGITVKEVRCTYFQGAQQT